MGILYCLLNLNYFVKLEPYLFKVINFLCNLLSKVVKSFVLPFTPLLRLFCELMVYSRVSLRLSSHLILDLLTVISRYLSDSKSDLNGWM